MHIDRKLERILWLITLFLIGLVGVSVTFYKPSPAALEQTPRKVVAVADASASPTPTRTPTPTPTLHPTPTPISFDGFVRVSNYWPPDGGTNCAYFVGGVCKSRMASLERWQEWMYKAAACPMEWPFGTLIEIEGRTWICLDRGGAVEYRKGIPYVDLLTDEKLFRYGQILRVTITLPLTVEALECLDERWQFCSW